MAYTDDPEYRDMDEYYNKPVRITCVSCNLTHPGISEGDAKKGGWVFENGQVYCFQAKCQRDRSLTCPQCKLPNTDGHYLAEHDICAIYERAWSEAA